MINYEVIYIKVTNQGQPVCLCLLPGGPVKGIGREICGGSMKRDSLPGPFVTTWRPLRRTTRTN